MPGASAAILRLPSRWQTGACGHSRCLPGPTAWSAGPILDQLRLHSHEHLDDHGIIHMNGRIYDPHLARFLQADPFVEDPGTLNRYTYVHNNPLVYYDPSGYFSLKSFLKIRAAVEILFLGGQIIAGKIWASLGIKAGSAAAYGVAAAAGALSGYIMTSSLEGTLWGAFSAATFYGIGRSEEHTSE